MRKLLALTCVALFALAAAGCGSSGGSESGDDTTTTKAQAATTTTAADDDDTSTTEGDGDVEPTDVTGDEYEAAFVIALTSGDRADGNLVLPDDVADCIAPEFVTIMTVEGLNEAGITEEDASDPGFDPADANIDEDQAREVIDAFGTCDFDIYGELAASLTVGLGSDVQECARENMDQDLADALMVKSFSGGESDAEFEAFLADLSQSCDLPDM